MENKELIAQCTATAQQWIDSPLYDAETKKAVKAMIEAEDKPRLSMLSIARWNLVREDSVASWDPVPIV